MSEGQILAGRYELGAVLGRGGMAEVRAGWDRRLGRPVAVKTLRPDLAEQPTIRRSFEGEARAAARIAHPNAVAVLDVGEDGGVPFLVMEQVIGPTLAQEMAAGRLDAGRVRRLGAELLAALGAAHAAGLVHRDVKPSNVLMTPEGSAKVADFGIAKAVDGGETTTTQMDLTATGDVIGTVAYMAPERLAGRPATVQSDVYSVGVVLYEALTGDRPFAAATPVAMIRAIDQGDAPPLSQRCPGLDAALTATVERAMARDPDDRYASAAEMSAGLRSAAEPPASAATGATPTVGMGPATEIFAPLPAAPPAVPHHRAGRFGRRGLVALLAVAGLALGLVTAVALTGGDTAPPSTPAGTVPPSTTGGGIPPVLDDVTGTETTEPGSGDRGKGKDKGEDDDGRGDRDD